jgi:hypothetical protein
MPQDSEGCESHEEYSEYFWRDHEVPAGDGADDTYGAVQKALAETRKARDLVCQYTGGCVVSQNLVAACELLTEAAKKKHWGKK